MNTNDKQKLNLIFKFVETFQNQIKSFDFNINNVKDKNHIAGIIKLNKNSNFEKMKYFLIDFNINKIFDYWEMDKEGLFIEME